MVEELVRAALIGLFYAAVVWNALEFTDQFAKEEQKQRQHFQFTRRMIIGMILLPVAFIAIVVFSLQFPYLMDENTILLTLVGGLVVFGAIFFVSMMANSGHDVSLEAIKGRTGEVKIGAPSRQISQATFLYEGKPKQYSVIGDVDLLYGDSVKVIGVRDNMMHVVKV